MVARAKVAYSIARKNVGLELTRGEGEVEGTGPRHAHTHPHKTQQLKAKTANAPQQGSEGTTNLTATHGLNSSCPSRERDRALRVTIKPLKSNPYNMEVITIC